MDLNTAASPSNRLSVNVIRTTLVVGAIVLGLLMLLAKPIAGASLVAFAEDAQAAAAVRAVADPSLPVTRQLASIPAQFAEVQGYRPVEIAGYPVDPEGSCTSPVSLPASFDAPCQAHDLGYDLLRYAAASGHALGPWAREALDAAFAHRLADACDNESGSARGVCEAAATVAVGAVRFNSWRQDFGVPVPESPADLVLSLFTKADRS